MDMERGKPRVLRDINKSLVVNVLREQGPLSRAQVAKVTKLTRATVSEVATDLLDEGIIIEGGPASTPVGRKGTLLQYHASHKYGISIDLGGTTISIGIFDMNGKLLNSETVETFKTDDREYFLEQLIKYINDFMTNNKIDDSNLLGIGVASPGIVDYENGIVVEGSPNLPDWEQLHVSDILYAAFKVPIIVENDVRAALVGEISMGKCADVKSAVLLSLGTGLGSAILLDGHIVRGAGDAAGEIGYMLFNRDHLAADWGNKGCFESIASGSGIEAKVKPNKTAEDIFMDAKDGEELAIDMVDEVIDYLSIGMLNLITVVNPEKIVLTGGVSRALTAHMDTLNENIKQHTFTRNRPKLVVSDLFEKAPLYGISILTLSTIRPDIEFLKGVNLIQ